MQRPSSVFSGNPAYVKFAIWVLLLFPFLSQAQEATIKVDGILVTSLEQAFARAQTGSTIDIGPGELKQAGILRVDEVTIRGTKGQTKIHSKSIQGKGPLVIQGDNILIENIECFNINVAHENGACVRFEGRNLELNNVHFHSSQQGLLTGHKPGRILIRNSKFENLGKNGQAHGIYVGGGELFIFKSEFLASKSEGMEVKSRAKRTIVERSVIASLDGRDSRLLDVPNGGELVVKDSILQQGDNTSNADLIGFGLEGYKHDKNSIRLEGNIIIMEREAVNRLLHIKNKAVAPDVYNNVLVGKAVDEKYEYNTYFRDRDAAGIKAHPALPKIN